MKRIIIIFMFTILLFSCGNNNIGENSEYIKKQNISGEAQIITKKVINKNFEIIEDIEYSGGKNNQFLIVNNFSDNNYKEFEKFKNLNGLNLTINNLNGKKGIHKTLTYIKNNFFSNKIEHTFSIADYPYYFTDNENDIISTINIVEFNIDGKFPDITLLNPSKKEIERYKKEVKEFDTNMKNLLNKSITINKILVLDYKIFTKKDGKIEIEDTRMNKELLEKYIK